jgi:hypothetical protein
MKALWNTRNINNAPHGTHIRVGKVYVREIIHFKEMEKVCSSDFPWFNDRAFIILQGQRFHWQHEFILARVAYRKGKKAEVSWWLRIERNSLSNTMQHGDTRESILRRSGVNSKSKDPVPICSLTDIQNLDIRRLRELLLQIVLYGRHYDIARYQCYWFCWFMITVIQRSSFLGPLSFQAGDGWDMRGRYHFLPMFQAHPGLRLIPASLLAWFPIPRTFPLWVIDMRFAFENTLELDHFIQVYRQKCLSDDSSKSIPHPPRSRKLTTYQKGSPATPGRYGYALIASMQEQVENSCSGSSSKMAAHRGHRDLFLTARRIIFPMFLIVFLSISSMRGFWVTVVVGLSIYGPL